MWRIIRRSLEIEVYSKRRFENLDLVTKIEAVNWWNLAEKEEALDLGIERERESTFYDFAMQLEDARVRERESERVSLIKVCWSCCYFTEMGVHVSLNYGDCHHLFQTFIGVFIFGGLIEFILKFLF